MDNDTHTAIASDLATYARRPDLFVLWAFPWASRGDLERARGPRTWQLQILKKIADSLSSLPTYSNRRTSSGESSTNHRITNEQFNHCLRIAISSGHGIGKSALVAWIILWGLCTMVDTRIIVTANTEPQLRTKTWPELAKWYRMLICRDWFNITATSLHSVDPDHEKNWRADAIPWNEQRTESFAGLHNEGKRLVVIFDEASAIHDAIHEVTEGALTDANTEMFWFQFGNPTRNTGRFHDHFHRLKKRWDTAQIDARDVEGANQDQFQQWVEDYGEDSDFVRVRVKGQFPRAGTNQFMPSDIVESAMDPNTEYDTHALEPLILAADIARFGNDESAIHVRWGRDARNWGNKQYRGLDTMQMASEIVRVASSLFRWPDAIFVDEGGVGGGVIDRLRQLGYSVVGINFGARADVRGRAEFGNEGEKYANKRAEMYGSARQWLRNGGMLPDDPELMAQLTGPEYAVNIRGEIQIERKEDMAKRGLSSPDRSDAFILTFAYPVSAAMDGAAEQSTATLHEWNPIS